MSRRGIKLLFQKVKYDQLDFGFWNFGNFIWFSDYYNKKVNRNEVVFF